MLRDSDRFAIEHRAATLFRKPGSVAVGVMDDRDDRHTVFEDGDAERRSRNALAERNGAIDRIDEYQVLAVFNDARLFLADHSDVRIVTLELSNDQPIDRCVRLGERRVIFLPLALHAWGESLAHDLARLVGKANQLGLIREMFSFQRCLLVCLISRDTTLVSDSIITYK